MDWAIEELKKDFKQAVSEVDFKNYDPYSRVFMKPLFIGQLLMAMKSVYDENDVEEELLGAEDYINRYLASGDSAYKDMANDELRHAGILIKKHNATADEKKKAELAGLEQKRQDLIKYAATLAKVD